jgi:hypothetical protein
MPYWLMNFEEHCEVFITSTGDERQADCDILAKCLLQARSKNRLAESIGKLTVDAPIPYLLSDLTTIIRTRWASSTRRPIRALYAAEGQDRRAEGRSALQFMFSGMLVGDTMADFPRPRFSACPAMASRSRSSTYRACRPTSPRPWSRCCRAGVRFAIWSRDEPQRPILLVCEEAHRYVPSDRTPMARCAPSLSVSPRKAANTAFRSA